MDIDQLSKMIESELQLIDNFNKVYNSSRGVLDDQKKSSVKNQLEHQKSIPSIRRTLSHHSKALTHSNSITQRDSNQPTHSVKLQKFISNKNPTQSVIENKQKQNLPQKNQIAKGYTQYAPPLKCEKSKLTLDDFLNQNDLNESLLLSHRQSEEIKIVDQTRKSKNKLSTEKSSSDSQCSFRPMLLRKSLQMAEKLENPTVRLMKKREQLDQIQEHSFQPKINKLPNYLKNQMPLQNQVESDLLDTSQQALSYRVKNNQEWDNMPRWQQLYEKGKISKQYLENQRESSILDNSQNSENTFQPDISKSQNNYKDFQGQSDLSFVERHNCWEQLKQQRLAQRKQEVQNQAISQCSFRPSLSKSRQSISPNKVSEFGKKGWVEFFDRVGMAHQKKKNLQNVRQYGQNWKNKLTRPQEPKMLSRSRTKSFNSSKENLGICMNFQNNLAPEIQHLRNELQSWNY